MDSGGGGGEAVPAPRDPPALQVPPPEGCTELSAPGDTVHIHYTVRGGRREEHVSTALRRAGRGGGGGSGTGGGWPWAVTGAAAGWA